MPAAAKPMRPESRPMVTVRKTRMGIVPSMTDLALVTLSMGAPMTADQMTGAVELLSRCSGGGTLMRGERDWLMAICRAAGLVAREPTKPKRSLANYNPGDPYSDVETAGTATAKEVLARAKTPSGHMIVPPSRRVAG